MRYRIRKREDKGNCWWTDGQGVNRLISGEATEVNEDAIAAFPSKLFLIEPVEECQPEPGGNPADITQCAEVAEPTPDFETAPAPRSGKKRGKRR